MKKLLIIFSLAFFLGSNIYVPMVSASENSKQVENIKDPARQLFNFLNEFGGISSPQNESETPTEGNAPSSVDTTPYNTHKTLGTSTNGHPIEIYEFWNGDENTQKRVVFIGGIHGGYEWNTILLAYRAIDFFTQNPSSIPAGIKVQIIPSANPDGQMRTIGKIGRFDPPWSSVSEQDSKIAQTRSGRLNGNSNAPQPPNAPYSGVDLNRNWSCRHTPNAKWGSVPVSGGAAPYSEKETQVLKQFLENDKPLAVVYWHSQWSAIFAGGCDTPHNESLKLQQAYAAASGYSAEPWYLDNGITGDASDWLASIDVPAIIVELKNHTDIDWAENLAGIKATLAYAAPKVPSVQQPEAPIPTPGGLVMYRQGDYSNQLPHGCTIAQSGCGPTAVANVVSSMTGRTVTPPSVVEAYRGNGSFLGCSGSTMAGAKTTLEKNYNFITEVIIKEGSAPMEIDEAIPKILPFLRSGSMVFIGANFQTKQSGGHYAIIVDIKQTASGYEIYALDSAYGNRTVIPVNYKYMHPKPYIKKAMAVRPK